MTLVVTDASKFGIVMVGDSAVTNRITGKIEDNARKVHYVPQANIGISLWGSAVMPTERIDKWIEYFIRDDIAKDEDIDSVCSKLEDAVNTELAKLHDDWDRLERGMHVAGYKDGFPVIYHLYTQHGPSEEHRFTCFKDYPYIHTQKDLDKLVQENPGFKLGLWDLYQLMLNNEHPIHLRNGYIPHFGILFEKIYEYSKELGVAASIKFPSPSIERRVEYFEMLVRFVADTLRISNVPQEVNGKLTSIGFDRDGLKVDKRQVLREG